jgi:polyisoprenoid-binding protein YceI
MTTDRSNTAATSYVERRPTGAAVPVIRPGRWEVDPARSSIGFVARHLLVTKVKGRFTRLAGSIEVTEDPSDSSVRAMADTTSLTTGDRTRDDHLRSADFFDVEQWPTIAVVGSGLRSKGAHHTLEAQLTIRNITHPVDFVVTATNLDPRSGAPIGADDAVGRPTARFTADATVNRKDFGLHWNAAIETGGVVVGDMVELVLVAVAEFTD